MHYAEGAEKASTLYSAAIAWLTNACQDWQNNSVLQADPISLLSSYRSSIFRCTLVTEWFMLQMERWYQSFFRALQPVECCSQDPPEGNNPRMPKTGPTLPAKGPKSIIKCRLLIKHFLLSNHTPQTQSAETYCKAKGHEDPSNVYHGCVPEVTSVLFTL